jgi:4-hydroxy-tetrahydrodipicolinate reductase
MRIGVTGATGRMGRAVIEAGAGRDVTVAFAVNRDPDEPAVRGVEVHPATAFENLLEEESPDAVVDFTGPESSVDYAETAARTGVPIVIGTTGFDESQLAALETAGEETPVLLGANFGRGVQALVDAVQAALASLPGYDVELTETHHNAKLDAPSGTAGMILDAIDEARETDAERVHGREGDAPRSAGEIGVHARRAGDVTGEHEILLAGNEETLSLTHRAGSRSVFAEGALDAAAWLATQPAGFYRFADVADQLE